MVIKRRKQHYKSFAGLKPYSAMELYHADPTELSHRLMTPIEMNGIIQGI